MANYVCSSRTNYFRVKDRPAFDAWANELGLQVVESDLGKGICLLNGTNEDSGAFDGVYPKDADGYEDYDKDPIEFCKLLAPFLADGSVCVIMEAGAEKLRYVCGHALAFDNTGKRVDVDLNQIYRKAELQLKGEVTRAEY